MSLHNISNVYFSLECSLGGSETASHGEDGSYARYTSSSCKYLPLLFFDPRKKMPNSKQLFLLDGFPWNFKQVILYVFCIKIVILIVCWLLLVLHVFNWTQWSFFVKHTVCPRSSNPFYIVSYCMKWLTTSWTMDK